MAAESDVRVVRVNATPSFAMRWLIPQLASFQIRQPRTEVRVSTSPFDDIVSLEGDYDVIIRRDTMKRIGYQCHFLINDESLAVTSPSFVSLSKLKHSSDISPGMLLHMKSRPDAWTRWFNSAGLLPVEAISGRFFDHFFLSIEAAINGIGVALAPKVLVEEDIRLGRLVELFPENTISGSGFHFLSREVGSRRAHLNEFVAWLKTGGNAKRPSVTRSRT